jgi:hypothetical protein
VKRQPLEVLQCVRANDECDCIWRVRRRKLRTVLDEQLCVTQQNCIEDTLEVAFKLVPGTDCGRWLNHVRSCAITVRLIVCAKRVLSQTVNNIAFDGTLMQHEFSQSQLNTQNPLLHSFDMHCAHSIICFKRQCCLRRFRAHGS